MNIESRMLAQNWHAVSLSNSHGARALAILSARLPCTKRFNTNPLVQGRVHRFSLFVSVM